LTSSPCNTAGIHPSFKSSFGRPGADNLLPRSVLRNKQCNPDKHSAPGRTRFSLHSTASLSLLAGTTNFAEKNALPSEPRPQRDGAGGIRTRDRVVPTAFVPASPSKSRSTQSPRPSAPPAAFRRRTPQSSRRPGPKIHRRSGYRPAPRPGSCRRAEYRRIQAAPAAFAP
jgi:hypothetical protein